MWQFLKRLETLASQGVWVLWGSHDSLHPYTVQFRKEDGVGFPGSLLSGCELFCSFQQAIRTLGWGSEETAKPD